jgi:formate dehydrogenase major subunit
MNASRSITLTVDGRTCVGTEGQTILQVAAAGGIVIPTLCYLKHLSPWGGCRMCIVEVQGNPKVVPACSTPATDGAVITTGSDRLVRLRRLTLELLFSERNHVCPMCPMNGGDCELQTQALRHGMDAVRFPYLYPALPVDLSGRYFGLDHNRCILCTRCVRVCEEIEGVHTLDIAHRGARNLVVVDLNASFGTSTSCTSCGACVAACPTGALFDKAQAFRGKLHRCQTVTTTCLECPVGCGLEVFVKDHRVVEVFGDFASPINAGHLCVKGRYETWAQPRARLLTPMLRQHGALKRASWTEALAEIARAAGGLKAEQKAVLASPRLTNEALDLLRGFGRVGVAVARDEAALARVAVPTSGAMTTLEQADAIILLGALPSRDNGVVAAKIRTTVRRRGARLLVFNSPKSDLDLYADVCAHEVSVEHKFWEHVAHVLAGVKQPVLVYGPAALTPIGVTVMEKLIGIFEQQPDGAAPALVPLPVSTNLLALAAAELEPVEDLAAWLDERPLRLLHILASDEPDGGARLLAQKHVRPLLDGIECVVVSAAYRSSLTDRAHVVLPAAIWAEKSGTLTNFQGEVAHLRAVLSPRGEARSDTAILEALRPAWSGGPMVLPDAASSTCAPAANEATKTRTL